MNANDGNPFSRWFLVELFFPKRIGRLSYFMRSCAVWVLAAGLIGASRPLRRCELIMLTVLLTACVYTLFWVVLPRMRDLSIRPCWLTLILVPVLNAAFYEGLLFRPRPIWSFAAQPPPLPKQGQLTREAEQREEQREGASKLRHRVVLAVGAAVAASMVGVLILLALPVFWVDQANRYLNAKDYANALPLLQKAADAGNPFAKEALLRLHSE